MKKHHHILKRVIDKGGLLGECAGYYINDEKLATIYIIELSEQCHVEHIQKSWGTSLVNDIIEFSLTQGKIRRNFNDDS